MTHPITRRELIYAQATLIVAIILQLTLTQALRFGSHYLVVVLELLLVMGIGITGPKRHEKQTNTHRNISVILISLVSLANAGQLALLTKALLNNSHLPGKTLLTGALAIFLTNIIMFALWFWEMDSPGLSGRHKTEANENFLFPQLDKKEASWKPAFPDYLYVSLTNSTAFSPTDTLPLTHRAKSLMSIQALISLLTVVLVTARSVNILG